MLAAASKCADFVFLKSENENVKKRKNAPGGARTRDLRLIRPTL
jgi:hypothetical protein